MDRVGSKKIAKINISKNFTNAAIVYLFLILITMSGSFLSDIPIPIEGLYTSVLLSLMTYVLISMVQNAYNIGFYRFTLLNSSGKPNWQESFSVFKENPLNIFLVTITTNIFIFLWTLLLIIPGIIKCYKWFFVPMILAENPEIKGSEARKISSEMTKGIKFDLFITQLSFIGWVILIFLTFFILSFYVIPYINQTFSQIYLARKSALNIKTVPDDEVANTIPTNNNTKPQNSQYENINKTTNNTNNDPNEK